MCVWGGGGGGGADSLAFNLICIAFMSHRRISCLVCTAGGLLLNKHIIMYFRTGIFLRFPECCSNSVFL